MKLGARASLALTLSSSFGRFFISTPPLWVPLSWQSDTARHHSAEDAWARAGHGQGLERPLWACGGAALRLQASVPRADPRSTHTGQPQTCGVLAPTLCPACGGCEGCADSTMSVLGMRSVRLGGK